MSKISTLFLDIGGVLMTNGWDRFMREKAALSFDLDLVELEKKHHQFFDIYETGKSSLEDYLKEVVFWTERSFSMESFKKFIFAQSKPYPDMIAFFTQIKKDYQIRIAAISNEGRELAEYRIKKAHLTSFIDDFFISSFVGYQKPNPQIFRMALDVTQTSPQRAFYIDDRKELVEAAKRMGIQGIVQISLLETRKKLLDLLRS